MSYNSLHDFVKALEAGSELIRVKVKVSSELEISEITDRVVKSNNNKALLFENTGTAFPLLINAFGSEKRICIALGRESLDNISQEIETVFTKITKPQAGLLDKLRLLSELKEVSSWMPKKLSRKGLSQDVIMQEPDLFKLPILKCWPFDGGNFITLPVVHTKHPESNIRNVGMYRMQVYDSKTTGMHWHLHKDSAKHYNAYKALGKRMPVSITLGGDPVYTYVASAPLPENVDEYILAGFLRKKKVELVKCLTNDIYVPADVDFVIEGYVDVNEPLRIEGPFGDHTGFYSLPDYYPVFHVTCITHKKNAIYPATIVGIPPQEDAWLAKATERIFLSPLRLTMLPEIVDLNLPIEGVFHNIALVKIKNDYHGHAFKVMNTLWGAGQMMFNKIMVVTDQTVDVFNYMQLVHIICTRINPATDILFSKGPLDVLDHSTDIKGFGGKIGIDATGHDKQLLLDENDKKHIFSELENFKANFNEIIGWNDELIKEGYGILIIAIEKTSPDTINIIKKAILKSIAFAGVRYIVFIESLINPNDIVSIVWRGANNIEPLRDCELTSNSNMQKVLVIDATMKSKTIDKFNKEWPNIITSDVSTIALVDSKWEQYKMGSFIKSPSLKYSLQKYEGNEAVEGIS